LWILLSFPYIFLGASASSMGICSLFSFFQLWLTFQSPPLKFSPFVVFPPRLPLLAFAQGGPSVVFCMCRSLDVLSPNLYIYYNGCRKDLRESRTPPLSLALCDTIISYTSMILGFLIPSLVLRFFRASTLLFFFPYLLFLFLRVNYFFFPVPFLC